MSEHARSRVHLRVPDLALLHASIAGGLRLPPGIPSSACNCVRDGRLQATAAACHKCSRLVSASPPAHRLRRQAGERRRGGRGARALRAGGAARVAARAGRHRSRRRAARCRLAVRPQRVVGGRGRRCRVRLVVRLAQRHRACAQCVCVHGALLVRVRAPAAGGSLDSDLLAWLTVLLYPMRAGARRAHAKRAVSESMARDGPAFLVCADGKASTAPSCDEEVGVLMAASATLHMSERGADAVQTEASHRATCAMPCRVRARAPFRAAVPETSAPRNTLAPPAAFGSVMACSVACAHAGGMGAGHSLTLCETGLSAPQQRSARRCAGSHACDLRLPLLCRGCMRAPSLCCAAGSSGAALAALPG